MQQVIADDVYKLREYLDQYHPNEKVVVTSGGFDPIHQGHVRCILESAELKGDDGKLIVICNSNEWLKRKKGYALMPEEDRTAIVAGLKGVDFVVVWDDGTKTVCGALEALRPNIFAKGGDRDSSQNVPEFETCKNIGCEVMFNVGGGKIQSSSSLVNTYTQSIKQ